MLQGAGRLLAKEEDARATAESDELELKEMGLALKSKLFHKLAVRKDEKAVNEQLVRTKRIEDKDKRGWKKDERILRKDLNAAKGDKLKLQNDMLQLDASRSAERRAEDNEAKAQFVVAKDARKSQDDAHHRKNLSPGESFLLRNIAEKYEDGEDRMDEHASRIDKLKAKAKTVLSALEEDREEVHAAVAELGDAKVESREGRYDEAKADLLRREARKLDREAEKDKGKAIRGSSDATTTKVDAERDVRKEKHALNKIMVQVAREKHHLRYAHSDLKAAEEDAARHRLHLRETDGGHVVSNSTTFHGEVVSSSSEAWMMKGGPAADKKTVEMAKAPAADAPIAHGD